MSIVPTSIASDPNAPLAWIASVVVIALEKLNLAISLDSTRREALTLELELDEEEKEAFPGLSQQMRLLSEASAISGQELFLTGSSPMRSELRESFSTLVAIERDFYSPAAAPDFEKTANELDFITARVQTGDMSDLTAEMLIETQKVCLELLEHLDNSRHALSVH